MTANNSYHNLLKNISECTVIDTFIEDSLRDIDIISSPNQYVNSWWNGSQSVKYYEGPENISISKNNFFNFSPDSASSFWKPLFIDSNTLEQKISQRGIYNKKTLGTNEYLSFAPSFKKDFSVDNARMAIPWKLNSDDFPYDCTTGILFWFCSSLKDTQNSETNKISWSNLPLYMPFFYGTLGPYIKLTENRILTPPQDSVYTYDINLANNLVQDKPENVFGDNYQNLFFSINAEYATSDQNTLRLWIADGDVFSYTDPARGLSTEPQTYISAPLYQHYTAIYHAITLDRKRSFNRDIVESRRYKNLAKYLASSPFITKFCINALPDYSTLIKEYINGNKSLVQILSDISRNLNDNNATYDQDINLQPSASSNNLITTSKEFFTKLKNKYGAKLAITGSGKLNISKFLPNKDDIAIANTYSIYTKNSEAYTSDANNYLFFHQNFNTNNYTIGSRTNDSTAFDAATTLSDRSINIYSKTNNNNYELTNYIPLYDSIAPMWNSSLILNIFMKFSDNRSTQSSWTTNYKYKHYSLVNNLLVPTPSEDFPNVFNDRLPHVYFKILSSSSVPAGDFSEESALTIVKDKPFISSYMTAIRQFRFLWEHVSGPPVKFTDNNISDDDLYDTSSSAEVRVVVSQYAKYTVKCTVITPFGNFVKYKTFFFVDGSDQLYKSSIDEIGNTIENIVSYTDDQNILAKFTPERSSYDGPIAQEQAAQNIPIVVNRYGSTIVKAAGFKKVAINARGLIWPVDTEFQVARYGNLERYIENISGPRYKFQTFEADRASDAVGGLAEPFDIYSDAERDRPVSIEYILDATDTSATVYIDKIVIENIRNGSDECAQCLSTYNSDLTGFTTWAGVGESSLAFTRINTGISLEDVRIAGDGDILGYDLPPYSLDYSPKIYKYGRYNTTESLNAINNSTVFDDHPMVYNDKLLGIKLPNDTLTGSRNAAYSAVTGYKLNWENTNNYEEGVPDYKYKICYQKALDVINSNDTDRDFYIDFVKGTFHPEKGWLYDNTNTSHVLKFNPGARDSFSFNGPTVTDLNSCNIGYNTVSKNLLNANIEPTILPNIYSSTIGISIAPAVRWDPVCECPPGAGASDFEKEQFALKTPFRVIQNQIHKEMADAQSNYASTQSTGNPIGYRSYHGYRILGGGVPKTTEGTNGERLNKNDEFIFNKQSISSKNNVFEYAFSSVGPAKNNAIPANEIYDLIKNGGTIPSNISDAENQINLRDPRVNDFTIKDIEIQLDFLNYINTQDLIIWLEVQPCDQEVDRQKPQPFGSRPPTYPGSINSPSQYIDQTIDPSISYKSPNYTTWSPSIVDSNALLNNNFIGNSEIGSYLKNLIDVNSTVNPGDNFKLYLLNQEYIQNNQYNLTVRFSDHADISNETHDSYFLYDNKSFVPHLNKNRRIISDKESIIPSLAAMGYTEKEHIIYKNIIKQNNLWVTNNSFSKLYNKPLFLKPIPPGGCPGGISKQQSPSLNSDTKFILKIAIVDEPDVMQIFDNLRSSAILTNFIGEYNVLTSSNIFNNLCRWQLILHTDSCPKNIPSSIDNQNYGNGDAMSLIDYNLTPKTKDWYGYNFIADFSDKQFLLPLININAPYSYTQDFDLCSSAVYSPTKSPSLVGPPQFPTEAIIQILAGNAAAAGFVAGVGLAGVGIAGDSIANNPGYASIINYFDQVRRWRSLPRRLGAIFNIAYTSYPFGSAEKVLLNLSKDGCFWYTAEAAIFRLSNTPVVEPHVSKPLLLSKIENTDELTDDQKLSKTLGEFSYEIINNAFEELFDNSFLTFDGTVSCANFKQSINTDSIIINDNNTVKLYNGDVIRINLDNSEEENQICSLTSDAGESTEISGTITYLVEQSTDGSAYNWAKINSIGDVIAKVPSFSTINSVLSTKKWWQGDILIKIDSTIPFDLLDIGDSIDIFSDTDRINETASYQILSKAKILVDNKYQTILSLSFYGQNIPDSPEGEPRTAREFVSDNSILYINPDNKIIVLINPTNNYSSTVSSPVNSWGFDFGSNFQKQNPEIVMPIEHPTADSNPQIYFSTNSRGSYGDGSPNIRKNYLHSKINVNKFKRIHEVFNNKFNHKFKYNNIWTLTDNGYQKLSQSNIQGYAYNFQDASSQNVISENHILTQGKNSDSTFEIIQNVYNRLNSGTYRYNNSYEIIYIKSDSITSIYSMNTIPKLWIEGIVNPYTPISCDAVDQQRITALENEIDNDLLSRFQGNVNNYSAFFLEYPSIKTAIAYYNSIQSSSDLNLLNKIMNNISLLYEERNALLKLHSAPKIPSNGLSNIHYNIQNSNNNINMYNVTATVNNNYYWIHLDPKQSCSLAEELRPKVLKTTRYRCAYLNPNIDSVLINNNICPFNTGDIEGERGIESLETFETDGYVGIDVGLGVTYKYSIPEDKIAEEKELLSQKHGGAIANWAEQTIFRTFYMNSTGDITNIASNPDYLIYVEEIYDVAIPAEYAVSLEEAQTAGLIGNDGSADANYVSGISDSCGGKSPAGLGLVGDDNEIRSGGPARLCNIFNLDNQNSIKVKFRKIPRILRGIDFLGTIFRYSSTGQYRQEISSNPLQPLETTIGQGRLNNNMYMWECLEKNPNGKLEKSDQLPELMKLMNEMTFRAFFGSMDGIENRNKDIMHNEFAHQLIPFEFFTKPPPPLNPTTPSPTANNPSTTP